MKTRHLFFVLSLFCMFAAYGQEPPHVMIVQPINGAVFDGEQVKVDYFVSGTTPKSARILVDDKPAQLLTEVKIGQNTVMVDVPARNCKISIIARNEFGESLPTDLNLIWNGRIFKPMLYILAIGVSNYNDPDLQLQFASKDAIDFSETMHLQKGLLYEDVVIKILTDLQASSENIRDGLYWLQTETTQRDVAMLYMAGHGINNAANSFFFMPVNADVNRINATCIGWTEITETINAIAGKRILFMDACFSGNVLGNNRQRSTLNQAINNLTGSDNGAVVYTSSTSRQTSLENPEWNNGAFTKALVEGLNGKADPYNSKIISVKSLDLYITTRVKELTKGQQAPTTIIPGSVPDFPLAFVAEKPTLTTNPVTTFTTTTAILGGNIANAGTPAYTERGVVFATTQYPTIANNKTVISGTGTGNFSTNITGLATNTIYYVRAYATNTEGTAYGKQESFTTSEQTAPVITINDQPVQNTNVTVGSITGNLKVSASVNRGATLSYQWYRATSNSNIGGTIITGATSTNFTIPATLAAGTYYYFCEVRATGGANSIRSNVAQVIVFAHAPASEPASESTTVEQKSLGNEKPSKWYMPFYLGITTGASEFGTYTLGEIQSGGAALFGADFAYFFNQSFGAGLKLNVGICDVDYNYSTPFAYHDMVMFAGPALYCKLGNKWRNNGWFFTAGAGIGVLNWNLSNVQEANVSIDNESYTSTGGFLSAGICYMFTQHIGISLNVQSVFGSIKDQYDWERKPAGIGGTFGINFGF